MSPKHFRWRMEGDVGVVTLNRPERKNPLTFESYAELRDFFADLKNNKNVKAVAITGAGAILAMASDLRHAWGFFNQPVFQGN